MGKKAARALNAKAQRCKDARAELSTGPIPDRTLLRLGQPRAASAFLEEHDAVCVGAFCVVVHAPAVGGFGEFLVVDQDEKRVKASRNAAGKDGFFEFDFATGADFADFEGDVAAGF